MEFLERNRGVRAGFRIATVSVSALGLGMSMSAEAADSYRLETYANPVDLPYRYQAPVKIPQIQLKLSEAYREAADPTIVRYKGLYWLFASHSKGYWHSPDLKRWTFVEGSGFAIDKFAPTVVILRDRMYLATSESTRRIWTTDDPKSGRWYEAATIDERYEDPALFLDDDGRLYMYSGLASRGPLRVDELDTTNFRAIRTAQISQSRDKERRGWEVTGDNNEKVDAPSFVEGSWMTKRGKKYYLEYSAPGTEFKAYANGLLVSDNPMGPFVYQDYSPFAVKPTGFITGAGHGSTFADADGRWWHAGTMTISQRHIFERRLGLFPSRFTRNGDLLTDTYLGDYPRFLNGKRALTGWMLLSRRKAVSVSSTLDGFPAEQAVDEDSRTWWSAQSGGDEWFQIDLGGRKRIEAVQINFADQGSAGRGVSQDTYRYVLELSDDGRDWRRVIDHSAQGRDAPHDYQVLPRAEQARFVRLRNMHMPDSAKFSLYDLRVFGMGAGKKPGRASTVQATRNAADSRRVTLQWKAAPGAEFHIVRLGRRPDLMNQNFQVYDGATSLDVNSLNLGAGYCAAVDAVNENGITRATSTRCFD